MELLQHIFLKKEFFPDELPVSVFTYTHFPGMHPEAENIREFWKITMTGSQPITLFFYGQVHQLPPHTVFLSRPEDLTNIRTDSPAEITNLLILGPFMAKCAEHMPDNIFFRALKPESSGTPRQLFRIGATPGIRSRIRRIRTELANTDQCTPIVLQSLLQILLTDFCRQLDCETRKKLAGDQIAEINQYLQDHFREKITLQTLASHTGLSPNYLADKYKREMGCTIGWALRKIRISHAEKLLQEGILPHRQIRELCGFPDSSSFYRTFRKLKGVTPEEWTAASKEST